MKTALIAYLGCAAAFIVLDAIWLSWSADRLYRAELGALMRQSFDFAPVLVFYPLYLAAVVALAVLPGVEAGSLFAAAWRGALFGLVAYATYDLTNQATIAGWSWKVTLIDLVWGTVLTASAASAGWLAVRRLA